jgi:urea transport system ATP-binding protein
MLKVDQLQTSIGGSRILRGVTFEVATAEVFCLMGRNGVGKTTTLRTIVGLVKPSTGRIWFAGCDISMMSPEARAHRGIGYVPQGREIFPHLTVHENLMIGCVARGKKMNGEMDRMFSLFPILKEFLPRKGGMLSGGQQQQLAIARALLTRPKLLILDEPTEGIQPNIIDQIGEAIRFLRSGGHHDEAGLLAEISESVRKIQREDGHRNSELLDEITESVKLLRLEGCQKHPNLLDSVAASVERLKREDHQGNILGEEITHALRRLRAEEAMSILLVEQYLDFCKELGDTFAIMDRGSIVEQGPIAELRDEVVRRHLTV